jgi:hypothetical protein
MMATRFLEQWDAIVSALTLIAGDLKRPAAKRDVARAKLSCLTAASRLFLERVVPLLMPVAQVTTSLQTASYPSFSMSLVAIIELYTELLAPKWQALMKIVSDADGTTEVLKFRATLLQSLRDRYGISHDQDSVVSFTRMPALYGAALCADPRYKSLDVLKGEGIPRSQIRTHFKRLITALCPDEEVAPANKEPANMTDAELFNDSELKRLQTLSAATAEGERRLRRERYAKAQQARSSVERGLSVDAELDQYFLEPMCSLFEDPVAWWNSETRSVKWPRVYECFMFTACMQGTSAESERVFSTAG